MGLTDVLITFPPGPTVTLMFNVTIIDDDTIEDTTSFSATLSVPATESRVTVTMSTAEIAITDNDCESVNSFDLWECD